MPLPNKYLILLAAMFLSSCSLLGPVKGDMQSTYMLSAIPEVTHIRHLRAGTLLVTQPETAPLYNSTQMAYTTKKYQIAYFSKNQWAETPAQMLLPLMVQTLQKSHHFHAVVTPPYSGKYNYLLTTNILKLQQDFTHVPATVELVVRAQLIRAATSEVVSTKLFSISVPIRCRTPYSGVIAANQATVELLSELTRFCAR